MFQFTGLIILLIWSLGLLTPFTITGFIEILLITAFLNFLLKRIKWLNLFKIKLYKKIEVKSVLMK